MLLYILTGGLFRWCQRWPPLQHRSPRPALASQRHLQFVQQSQFETAGAQRRQFIWKSHEANERSGSNGWRRSEEVEGWTTCGEIKIQMHYLFRRPKREKFKVRRRRRISNLLLTLLTRVGLLTFCAFGLRKWVKNWFQCGEMKTGRTFRCSGETPPLLRSRSRLWAWISMWSPSAWRREAGEWPAHTGVKSLMAPRTCPRLRTCSWRNWRALTC